MVGPSPYRKHSFAALRAVFGPLWIRCDACRRFRRLRITQELRDKDHRRVRFTCRHCGSPGSVAVVRPNTEKGMEDYIDEDRQRAPVRSVDNP